jgi:hypothetical protein
VHHNQVFKLGVNGELLVAAVITCTPLQKKKFPNVILHCLLVVEIQSDIDLKLFQRWNLFTHHERVTLVDETYDEDAFADVLPTYLQLPQRILTKETNITPPFSSSRSLQRLVIEEPGIYVTVMRVAAKMVLPVALRKEVAKALLPVALRKEVAKVLLPVALRKEVAKALLPVALRNEVANVLLPVALLIFHRLR